MKFADLKKDYVTNLRYGRKAAETTCVGYQSHLNHYERYLASEGHPDADVEYALSADALQTYQYALARRGLRPRSIKGKFDPIRGMINFLIRRKALDADPLDQLTFGTLDAATRLTVSNAEVAALWDACLKQYDPRDVALSRAVIAAFCGTGIRASECAAMEIGHVTLGDEPTLFIPKGKGSKARTLYLTPECVVAFRAWLAEREKIGCEHDWFWAYGPRRSMSPDKLRELIERVKAIAGHKGAPNIKPHSLRHYFATNMLRNGATLKQIQAALGHTNLKQTAVYLHIDEADAKGMATLASFTQTSSAQISSDQGAADGPATQRQSPRPTKPGRQPLPASPSRPATAPEPTRSRLHRRRRGG